MIASEYYIKYPHAYINTIASLSLALKVPIESLNRLENTSHDYFRLHEIEEKPDGSLRKKYNLLPELKSLHRKIVYNILKKCEFPFYIKGSIKGGDYIVNASLHSHRRLLIKLDVSNFFDSISNDQVYRIWKDFFNFDADVASMLTNICCFEGHLVQGAPVSSYLANILFWKSEPSIVQQLEYQNILYTRYVDDISLSSSHKLTKEEISRYIKCVKKMMREHGVKSKRRKTKILSASKNMSLHNLNVNSQNPSLPKQKRDKIRADLHKLQEKTACDFSDLKIIRSLHGKINSTKRTNPAFYSKHIGIARKLLKDITLKMTKK